MSDDRRVLVTGASGFIGRHCLAPLVERGFDVHAVGRTRQADGGSTWHSVDLLDHEARRDVLARTRPTHLLHAAWYLEPGRYTGASLNVDWVVASLDLVRRFQEAGGRRVVAVGSCFEYAFGPAVLAESSPIRPATVYGACKQSLWTAIEALTRATDLSAAWARLFFLFGPHEDRRRLVADIASSLLEGRSVATSAGTQRRDYMYVADAGRALAAVLDSDITGPVNVATGEAPPVRELVELVATTVGRPELVEYGARPTPPGDPPEIRADIARLSDEVGWGSLTPRAEAVAETVAWWASALGRAPT
jgi:nucleoside-diphosphate-sugar epimerase